MPLIIATLLAATTTALSSPTDESHVCPIAAVCASVPETVSAALGRNGFQARRTSSAARFASLPE